MTVAENLALPLKMRRLSAIQRLPLTGRFMPGSRGVRAGIDQEVRDLARSLDIAGLLDRKPAQLSGGQRQRVALARAMVRRPALFLMDEPLSSLDAKLRTQMRAEIANLRHNVDATFVYVTHDQTEAMTMSDRVAVMFDGRIEQLGPPHVLYDRPATLRVAEFIGSPRINLLDGIGRPGMLVEAADSVFRVHCDLAAGTPVTLGVRPESLRLVKNAGPNVFSGKIQRLEYLGGDFLAYFTLHTDSTPLAMKMSRQQIAPLRTDDTIRVTTDSDLILVFDRDGLAIQSNISAITALRNPT
jgi:multiple sugar transport system ATP-binding protein